MFRVLGRLLLFVLVVAALSTATLAWLTLEFGPRPESSVQPLPDRQDVRFIEANGIRFGYLEKGSGPLILLFHGYPETARSWKAVQDRLAADGYRVIAPFLRGYPPTSFAEDGNYSVAALSQDVVSLIEAFGEEKAIIVGHDWGASAVYRTAMQRPDKVSVMVALSIPHPVAISGDPSVLIGANHFLYYQLPVARRLIWSYDFAHIDWIYRQWSPTYDPPQEELEDIKATLRVPGAIDGALGYYWSFFGAPAIDPTIKISVPSLVIAGSDDGTIDYRRFYDAEIGFDSPYRLVMMGGVGHFPQLEAPDLVADGISMFLRSLERPELDE